MLTYARKNEDVALWELSEGIPKTIIDIGASDGITNSNSRLFIERGWKALLIEPQAQHFNHLMKLYHDNPNVTPINRAIAQHTGTTPFLYNRVCNDHSRIPNDNYYSVRFGDIKTEEIEVSCLSMKDLFNAWVEFRKLGILSIDTEGYDEYILKDLIEKTNVRPKVIICEHHKPETAERQKAILSEYKVVQKISVNLIFKLK